MPLRRAGTPVSFAQTGARLCSASFRKSYTLRCVRGTAAPPQFTACIFSRAEAERGCMPPPAPFPAHYQVLVSSGAIEADAAQARAVEALGALEQRLSRYKPA